MLMTLTFVFIGITLLYILWKYILNIPKYRVRKLGKWDAAREVSRIVLLDWQVKWGPSAKARSDKADPIEKAAKITNEFINALSKRRNKYIREYFNNLPKDIGYDVLLSHAVMLVMRHGYHFDQDENSWKQDRYVYIEFIREHANQLNLTSLEK